QASFAELARRREVRSQDREGVEADERAEQRGRLSEPLREGERALEIGLDVGIRIAADLRVGGAAPEACGELEAVTLRTLRAALQDREGAVVGVHGVSARASVGRPLPRFEPRRDGAQTVVLVLGAALEV